VGLLLHIPRLFEDSGNVKCGGISGSYFESRSFVMSRSNSISLNLHHFTIANNECTQEQKKAQQVLGHYFKNGSSRSQQKLQRNKSRFSRWAQLGGSPVHQSSNPKRDSPPTDNLKQHSLSLIIDLMKYITMSDTLCVALLLLHQCRKFW